MLLGKLCDARAVKEADSETAANCSRSRGEWLPRVLCRLCVNSYLLGQSRLKVKCGRLDP